LQIAALEFDLVSCLPVLDLIGSRVLIRY
jgi:hypothetical protein